MKYKNIIVFLIGLLLIISGLFMGGLKGLDYVISQFTDSEVYLFDNTLQNKSYEIQNQNINKLDLLLNHAVINVYEDDIDNLLLSFKNMPKSAILSFDEYELTIEEQAIININNEMMVIDIYVPRDFVFDDVSLKVNGGVVELNHLHSKKLNLELNAGIIEGKSCLVDKKYDIKCNAGNIVFASNNSLNDYGYTIDCNIGKVIVDDIHYNGIVEYVSEHKDKMINIECNIGKVDIKEE